MDKSEDEGSKKIKERGREEREVGGGGIDTHFKIPAPNTTTEKGDLLALTLVWFKVGTGFIELDPEIQVIAAVTGMVLHGAGLVLCTGFHCVICLVVSERSRLHSSHFSKLKEKTLLLPMLVYQPNP